MKKQNLATFPVEDDLDVRFEIAEDLEYYRRLWGEGWLTKEESFYLIAQAMCTFSAERVSALPETAHHAMKLVYGYWQARA